MKLEVTRNYGGTREALRHRLDAMEHTLHTKYHTRTEWLDADTMAIGAPGVRGRLHVGDASLDVMLELSPVLRPLRSRIERELGRELDRVVEPSVVCH